jgi:hypothetical protein
VTESSGHTIYTHLSHMLALWKVNVSQCSDARGDIYVLLSALPNKFRWPAARKRRRSVSAFCVISLAYAHAGIRHSRTKRSTAYT